MDDKKQKDYKIPTMAAIAVTAAALLVAAGALSFRGKGALPTQGSPTQNSMSYYTPKESASQEREASPSPAAEGPYRVTIYNGKIGVFAPGEKEPFLTADVEVYLLPQEDIALLRKGLQAQSLTEVRSILEDYQ